jgi:vacuolar-type H+-ATPase subunit E/Vma4
MPLPQLLESLEHDAREEAERLDADSRAAAQDILDRARTRAAELSEEPVREAALAAEAEAARVRAGARMERAAALREVREAAVQDALAEVRERLAQLRERADHAELLRALADEARGLLPEAETLAVDPRDVAAIRALAGDWDVRLRTSYAGWGGVVISDARGRTVRNTLEERLSSVAPRARAIVAAGLSESSP